jgi:hypothetical protein
MSNSILNLVGQLITKTTLNAVYRYDATHKNFTSRYAEDLLYPTTVYPIYLQVQSNFKFCMQNRLLKRQDILEFKELLNRSVNLKDYRFETFDNDCHECYRKLKSTSISVKNMKCLNCYLKQFMVDIPRTEPEQLQVYGNLRVIK